MEKIKISIVEDFEVLAAYDGAEALFKEVNDFIPDVTLMDITLSGITGIEAAKVLKIDHPEVDVIMLTIHQDDKLVFDSLDAGASGYLTKNTDPERIVEAVKEARRL
ncbi:MAG: DNA-binding NarL/FixJ family response regulator [Sphingobacteriales bacterium]|jgi:DNA-binding NarL/FixJ family response regulator